MPPANLWNFPTSIHFGAGASRQLAQICRDLGIQRPLLITDQGLAPLPLIAQLMLAASKAGLAIHLFGDVQGNPTGADVAAAAAAFSLRHHDGLIGVGGGSALDVAKAVALIGRHGRGLWDLGGAAFDWSGLDPSAIVPLIALPTTAGTGSEVGRSAVIVHEASRSKKVIFHPALMPPQVVLDPELTVGLPPAITAATGFDAFVHCFEAYCAAGFHPMADGIALEGMRLISGALPQAYASGDDLEARGQMLAAATMGATAFQKDLGGVHALAHPLGAHFNLHHGLTNAVLLPYVMVANREAIAARMPLLGRVLGLDAANFAGVLAWVLAFRECLDIPHNLQELGVTEAVADSMGEQAAADPCAASNPAPLNAGDYTRILVNAVRGTL